MHNLLLEYLNKNNVAYLTNTGNTFTNKLEPLHLSWATLHKGSGKIISLEQESGENEGKIQNWGVMWLNLAGRVTLIKALLSILPIHQYVIIMAPASAHKQMELIIRSFLSQGGKQDNKKFSLVRWEQVTLPYEKGGIAIRLPRLMNIALGKKLSGE